MRHLIDFGDMAREEWDALYARASEIIDAQRNLWTYAMERCPVIYFMNHPPGQTFPFRPL